MEPLAADFATNRQLATLLRHNAKRVLASWEEQVRKIVPNDQTLSSTALRDSLPALLDNLAAALEDTEWTYEASKNVMIALEHGSQRNALVNYEFDQVVDEYALLRRILVRFIASDAAASANGVETVHAFLDAAIKHAGRQFLQLRKAEEHKELTDELDDLTGQNKSLLQQREVSRVQAQDFHSEKLLRSKVISMLGHDMRTPLTAAVLAAQQMSRHATDEPHKRQAARVVKGLERINAMIQDLLDADSLQSGTTLPIALAPCDLREVADRAAEELTTVHGERFVVTGAQALHGFLDAHAIQRALENLGNNAVKYGEAAARVSIHLAPHAQAAGQVVISVHNQGPPIPANVQSELFNLRFRAPTHQQSHSGWGIGLALVQAVAVAHGGKVQVQSSQAAGTTFSMELPMDSRAGRP